MEEMRALLDSLMGKDRNASLSDTERRKTSFKDPDVCKYYLVDFCPHELFPNTKRDLGRCDKLHSDGLKQQFQNDPDYEYYLNKYEDSFRDFLQSLVDQVEQKIKKGNERVVTPTLEITDDSKKKVEELNIQIAGLMKGAQIAGEKGEVNDAEELTRQALLLKKEIAKLTRTDDPSSGAAYGQKEKQLRVCATCGAMQSVGDSMSRFESHIAGKLHQGFERIRLALDAIKQRRENARLAREAAKEKEATKEGEVIEISDESKIDDKSRPSAERERSRSGEAKDGSQKKQNSPSPKRHKSPNRTHHSDSRYRSHKYDDRKRDDRSRRSSRDRDRSRDRRSSRDDRRDRHSSRSRKNSRDRHRGYNDKYNREGHRYRN